jgi:SAM (Sterile alpha motif) domain-containing protein
LRLDCRPWAEQFRENDIEAEVLAHLTGDDLIGIGVASVGHRRRDRRLASWNGRRRRFISGTASTSRAVSRCRRLSGRR